MTDLSDADHRSLLRDLSPYAQQTANWLRSVARAVKLFRLYKTENPIVVDLKTQVANRALELIGQNGPMDLRFTPSEVLLVDEAVIRPGKDSDRNLRAPELELPFQFFRDGIRRLLILPDVTLDEVRQLLDALRISGIGPGGQDDLVTLLWQGNLTHIRLETVPIEQTIHLSVSHGAGGSSGRRGLSFGWSPVGTELRADLGQLGPQGLHRDTFDDWDMPVATADVANAYAALENGAETARSRLLEEWNEESSRPWTERAPEVARHVLDLDATDETRAAFAHAMATWVGAALERCSWEEAQCALATLYEIDPRHHASGAALEEAIAHLDATDIAARLDEDDPADHARFASLLVAIGKPALDLACETMSLCEKVRPRAAASTAVCFMCSDHPEWLEPYIAHERWQTVRNAVFVLGQIGTDASVPLLRAASAHSEPRVRRAVVQALGSVAAEARVPLLIEQLQTRDTQLLAATLHMLTRTQDPRVAGAILRRIQAPDFGSRSAENKRAMFAALAEIADDRMVPPLVDLLNAGGWFATRTIERVAAARTLRRIGSEKALAALDQGLRSKIDVVRLACLDAMQSRMSG
ncbi:MAG TPA: HEAT repeat domain-containing protein [Candidatus Udaeobacter sp.]|nr:HEAT repeat domain-containing protein [Candidatus Udaeobacter sp.]